jgi:hypothetical protein
MKFRSVAALVGLAIGFAWPIIAGAPPANLDNSTILPAAGSVPWPSSRPLRPSSTPLRPPQRAFNCRNCSGDFFGSSSLNPR